MNFITMISSAFAIFGKGSVILKNPAALSAISKAVVCAILLVEGYSSGEDSKVKRQQAIDLIINTINLVELFTAPLPTEIEGFINTSLIPGMVDLFVHLFNSIGIFKKPILEQKEAVDPIVQN